MTTEPLTANKKIIQWGCKYLSSHGYRLKSNLPENVQNTPWSYVVRFATFAGYIYLKQTPKLLALEAVITQMLHDQFGAFVPEVIAHNAELNCFLMKDAGRPLREILKQQFDTALLCKAIDQFTSIQLAVADQANIFLDIGVPDWRLDKLPDLFKQLLAQKDILIADGLSEIEVRELDMLLPKISNLCKKLSDYSIKQTIVQCDFHDNNILIDDLSQNITIIDLGEIVISHPFFSLVGCLRQAKFHYALADEDDAYLQLMDACLKNYMAFESKKHLSDAFAMAQILWFIYEALAQYRLSLACDKARFMSFQRHAKLSGRLKEFIIACIEIDRDCQI
ncbi:MAG: phosphotransferase [Gammaproteobacteria bacterium]